MRMYQTHFTHNITACWAAAWNCGRIWTASAECDDKGSFGESMRVSSVTLYHAYHEGNEDAKDTWCHGQMKAKGFLKKKIRLGGGGASQGYDGFRMRKDACVDELDG